MTYRQLTLDERYQISAMRRQHVSPSDIATALGRHRGTITRELERNTKRYMDGDRLVVVYDPVYAHQQAGGRRVAKGVAARRIQGELQQIVESKLRQGWSPEQISGRLRRELMIAISHETIYQHVLRDTHEHSGVLRYCLRFGGYKHHRFRKSKHATRTRARKRGLDERPLAADRRWELGHWERDCVLGADSDAALLTVVDRKSRYSRIRRVAKLSADAVAKATVDALAPLGDVTRTITNDNGREFQRDAELEAKLGIPIFFCDPSSPWQRGSVENLNGLLRQFVPKKTNLDELPTWAPKVLEDTLNHRPRKTLGYRTPHEVFFDTRMELMSPSVRLGLEFSRLV